MIKHSIHLGVDTVWLTASKVQWVQDDYLQVSKNKHGTSKNPKLNASKLLGWQKPMGDVTLSWTEDNSCKCIQIIPVAALLHMSSSNNRMDQMSSSVLSLRSIAWHTYSVYLTIQRECLKCSTHTQAQMLFRKGNLFALVLIKRRDKKSSDGKRREPWTLTTPKNWQLFVFAVHDHDTWFVDTQWFVISSDATTASAFFL